MIKPSYNLSTLKTNHEIILFVRDKILEPMNLRIRLYPSFVRQANRCKNRDELIVLVHKLTKKASNLAREIGITKKVISPKRLDEKEEKTKVDSSPRERDLLPPSTPICIKGNTDLNKLGLSVWEQLHRYTPDVSDPEQTSRLAYYSKYQDIIKDVIDRFQIITISDGVAKNHEVGLKSVSFRVFSRLLNDLYTDGFLELEIISCGLRRPAYVFSTARCSKERFNRYTKRFRESEQHKNGMTKKGVRQNMLHEQKVNKVLDHNEAVRKGTIELQEQQEKQFIEGSAKRRAHREAEAEPQPKKLFTKPFSETETQDQLMINLISKMKPEQVQHDIKSNPRFKAEYDRLKGEGLL